MMMTDNELDEFIRGTVQRAIDTGVVYDDATAALLARCLTDELRAITGDNSISLTVIDPQHRAAARGTDTLQ